MYCSMNSNQDHNMKLQLIFYALSLFLYNLHMVSEVTFFEVLKGVSMAHTNYFSRNENQAIPPSNLDEVVDHGHQSTTFGFFSISIPPINLIFLIKLDSSNYLFWKEQLLSIIIAYGLEDVIDETSPLG